MLQLAKDPSFRLYAASMAALCLNLIFLWGYSGAARGKTKTTLNPEDAATVSKGAEIVPADPPEVARVLRAHTNAMASIVPFGFLGLLWVLLGATPMTAGIVFGVFTFFRWVHSLVYVWGKQPWRTIAFALAGFALLAVLGFVVQGLAAGTGG